jgi:hypothetical protein
MITDFLKEPIKLVPRCRSEVFHELIQNRYVVVRTTRITPRTIRSTKSITISIQLPLSTRRPSAIVLRVDVDLACLKQLNYRLVPVLCRP